MQGPGRDDSELVQGAGGTADAGGGGGGGCVTPNLCWGHRWREA